MVPWDGRLCFYFLNWKIHINLNSLKQDSVTTSFPILSMRESGTEKWERKKRANSYKQAQWKEPQCIKLKNFMLRSFHTTLNDIF